MEGWSATCGRELESRVHYGILFLPRKENVLVYFDDNLTFFFLNKYVSNIYLFWALNIYFVN